MTMKNSGFFLYAKLKGISVKDAVDKNGQPFKRQTMRVIFHPRGAANESTETGFITVPARHQLPDLPLEAFYTIPIYVGSGPNRLFLSLNPEMPIQPDTP